MDEMTFKSLTVFHCIFEEIHLMIFILEDENFHRIFFGTYLHNKVTDTMNQFLFGKRFQKKMYSNSFTLVLKYTNFIIAENKNINLFF